MPIASHDASDWNFGLGYTLISVFYFFWGFPANWTTVMTHISSRFLVIL